MSSPLQRSRVHLLSKKSERLQRNIFFFRPRFGTLLGGEHRSCISELACRLVNEIHSLGLNHELTSITPKTLHCWAKLCDPRCPDFEVYPVSLRKYAILRYSPEPIGPPISPDSTLLPGDYCLEVKGHDGAIDVVTLPFSDLPTNEESFAELEAAAKLPDSPIGRFLQWYAFPAGLEDAVTARDGSHCMITGSETDIGVSWVFPPAWSFYFDVNDDTEDPRALSVPSNAILMREDLISAFHDNAFGVDVDDNYRIVIFRDIGPSRDTLMPFRNEPAYFSRSAASTISGPDRNCLRQHFRRCVLVNIVGGDITSDYPSYVVRETMEKLGVITDDPQDEMAPMNHPLWHTPLGKEIFEDYMGNAMFGLGDVTLGGESAQNEEHSSRSSLGHEKTAQATHI